MASSSVRLGGALPVPLPARDLSDGEVVSHLASSIAAYLEERHVVGASVCVVRDGRIVLAQGFGCADLAGTPVDGRSTLFRAGSVSKVVTWTAVMQLIERGLLDESKDISEYLDFPVPRRFREPILIRHLMTHSAGFESNHFGYAAARGPGNVQSLARTLERNVPIQVRKPGELPVYDNWGAALAGRIVELVSGMPFEEYVDQHVFRPLQMARSTFREPVPAGCGSSPVGFVGDGPDFLEHPFEYYHNIGPAGSLTTTARDMANFMCAHLMEGRFDGTRLLSPESTRRMHTRAGESHPHLDGVMLGFYETYRNGRRTIGHRGATCAFESRLTLIPQEKLGIFVICNTGGGTGFCDAVVDDLIDHLFPSRLPSICGKANCLVRAYSGRYALSARSHSKSEKLFALGHTVDVRAMRDRLVIDGLTQDDPSEWVPIDNLQGVFRRVNGQETIAFQPTSSSSKPFLLGPEPLSPYVPISFFGAPRFTEMVQLLVPPVMAVFAMQLLSSSGETPLMGWLSAALALTNALIVGGLQRGFTSDQYSLLIRLPWAFEATSVLASISLVLTIAIVGVGLINITAASGTIFGMALVALGFTYWLKYWNILKVDSGQRANVRSAGSGRLRYRASWVQGLG